LLPMIIRQREARNAESAAGTFWGMLLTRGRRGLGDCRFRIADWGMVYYAGSGCRTIVLFKASMMYVKGILLRPAKKLPVFCCQLPAGPAISLVDWWHGQAVVACPELDGHSQCPDQASQCHQERSTFSSSCIYTSFQPAQA
jgi:hypothetical protein